MPEKDCTRCPRGKPRREDLSEKLLEGMLWVMGGEKDSPCD